MTTKTYYIEHIRDGSICLGDRVRTAIVGTYQDAVTAAHAIWRTLNRKENVYVHDEVYCLHYYHVIESNGIARDRNFNSGVVYSNAAL